MPSLCKTCLEIFEHKGRCPKCGSPRTVFHEELLNLTIAHMDCDAFYASVEKRDNPELQDKPVIIGGGKRGVVSTACYVARLRGVKSAMPMFQALKKCPDAVVIKPRMSVYAEVSKQIRQMMEELTPAIEPLSLDEAFLDMTGTERLHGAPPAVMLAGLVKRMKDELGLTGSIGLSHNKFLAKVASDLNKPQGFSVIGRTETEEFLRPQSIRMIWGVGPSGQEALERVGIRTFEDLRRWEKLDLELKFGSMGKRLWHLARGQDARRVDRHSPIKSISNETTFFEDIRDVELLDGHIWRLAEKVSARAKAKQLAGRTVSLRLKTAKFQRISRQTSLRDATQLADVIYRQSRMLLDQLRSKDAYRLIGVALGDLCSEDQAERSGDFLDPEAGKRGAAEKAVDRIREKFGDVAIIKGRSLR